MKTINTILYATDLSKTARIAMDWTKSLAANYEAEITIIHVIPDVEKKNIATFGASRKDPSISEERKELIDSKKEEILRLCRERQKTDPDCKIDLDHILVKMGQPAKEILATADNGNFDMVVVGTHGQSLIGKILTGSVAKRVVDECKVPVLTVRLSG